MNKDVKTATFLLLLAIGALLWYRPWQSEEITVGELPAVKTNLVAGMKLVTNRGVASMNMVTNDLPVKAVVDKLIKVATPQTNIVVTEQAITNTIEEPQPRKIIISVHPRLANGSTN